MLATLKTIRELTRTDDRASLNVGIVIVYLLHKASATMTELAEQCDCTTSAMTGLIDKLERLDIATRARSGRNAIVTLTDYALSQLPIPQKHP